MESSTGSSDAVYLLAGTDDGIRVFRSDDDRRTWQQVSRGLAGMDVAHAILDLRSQATIYAGAAGNGTAGIFRSCDFGLSWESLTEPFPDSDSVWNLALGADSEPGTLYAGVRPAGIYRSLDAGSHWERLSSLDDHPSKVEWWEGGAGGIYLHTVLVDHASPGRIYAGISVAGMFRSDDGGESWTAVNEGVTTFADETAQFPEVHRCIHKAVFHPTNPETIFQQNHMGVFRTDDGARTWHEITPEGTDGFGFSVAASHEATPAVFIVPQDENNVRFSGQLTVYRSRDGGVTWDRLTNGLPEVENLTLYRDGMAADQFDPAGVYFGTSDGMIWYTRDGGESWSCLADGMGKVRSVSVVATSTG